MHVIRTDSDLEALEDPELLALVRQRITDTAARARPEGHARMAWLSATTHQIRSSSRSL